MHDRHWATRMDLVGKSIAVGRSSFAASSSGASGRDDATRRFAIAAPAASAELDGAPSMAFDRARRNVVLHSGGVSVDRIASLGQTDLNRLQRAGQNVGHVRIRKAHDPPHNLPHGGKPQRREEGTGPPDSRGTAHSE